MNIVTVNDTGLALEVTLANGTVLWVPKDASNTDYAAVQAWVAAGGTIG
jgi:hypothetical protein